MCDTPISYIADEAAPEVDIKRQEICSGMRPPSKINISYFTILNVFYNVQKTNKKTKHTHTHKSHWPELLYTQMQNNNN